MPIIRQTSVSESTKLDFADGIKSILRQDPDIILIGEIRDADTAEMAFRAAMTGHQVYASLHSNSAIAIASVLIGLTLHNHLSTRTLEQQRKLLQTTSTQETQRYQQFLASLPQLPTNLETLRRITAGIDQLGAHRADPGNAFDIISHALDHYPEITVKHLDWQLSNPDQGSTTTILSAVLPLAAATDPGTSLQRIRALAAELNRTDAETSLLNLPFAMSPDKTLRSHSETSSKRPEFTLRLRLTKGPQP